MDKFFAVILALLPVVVILGCIVLPLLFIKKYMNKSTDEKDKENK